MPKAHSFPQATEFQAKLRNFEPSHGISTLPQNCAEFDKWMVLNADLIICSYFRYSTATCLVQDTKGPVLTASL